MNAEIKKQLLSEIEKATRSANSDDSSNKSWKYGHLNGLRKAAEILGITAQEEENAISKGLSKE